MNTREALRGARLVAELRQNPRSRLGCGCGSGRPTIWLVQTRDGKQECCYVCVRQAWREATV